MRLFLFLFMICFGSSSYASAIRLTVPPSVVQSESGAWSAANSATFSASKTSANFITQVEGQSVTFPQSLSVAANAASFVTPFLIPGPAGLLTSAVLSWIGQYGLQYLNSQWMYQPVLVQQNSTTVTLDTNNQIGWGGTGACGARPFCTAINAANSEITAWYGGTFVKWVEQDWNGSTWSLVYQYHTSNGYYTGSVAWSGTGSPSASSAPATQTNWNAVNNSTTPIPDAALNDLAKGGVAIPLTPQVNMTPQSVPLGVPVKDVITNNYYQDRATVTPTSSADPTQADLQVVKQQTDAAGNPVTNPADNTAVPPTKADDPCAEHPNRIGCMEKDDVKLPDLTQQAKTVTITPDTGWGSDTAACPADQQLNMKTAGATGVSFSWSPTCQFVDKLRPLVIACAWIGAVLIAVGIGRRGGA